jgi:hypothetical protein
VAGADAMGITIKPSDLFHRYTRDTVNRHEPKFSGKPDWTAFNRDDLYEVLPMLGKVMDELGRDDVRTLHALEEIMIRNMPVFVATREEVFDFLAGSMEELLEEQY